jgi:predicted transcriptional regulator
MIGRGNVVGVTSIVNDYWSIPFRPPVSEERVMTILEKLHREGRVIRKKEGESYIWEPLSS